MIILDEQRLRLLIQRLAEDAGDSSEVPKGLGGRSRLRILRNAMIAGVAAIAFVGVGAFAASELLEDRPGPVAPSPTPSPKPTIEQVNARGQIAFLSDRGKGYGQQIFLMSVGGSRLKKVTQSFGYSSKIDWSPDGKRIVMDRGLGEGRGSLVIVDAQTGEESAVLFDGDEGGRTALNPQSPSWSPDGSRIAFNSGSGDIYVIGVDGRDLERVTHSKRTCSDLYPDWSPDGTRIAFSRDCPGGGVSVVLVGGGPIERVTDHRRDLQPAWSPDGREIAFTRNPRNIMVVEVATGTLTQLTEAEDSYAPSWSPDGQAIVFATERGGTQDLWVMRSDGTDATPLTRDRPVDSAPVWHR